MANAKLLKSKVVTKVGKDENIPEFNINGSRVLFEGWLKADPAARSDDVELPKVEKGEVLDLLQMNVEIRPDEISAILKQQLADFESNNGIGKEKLVEKEEFFDEVKKVVDYDTLLSELELAADEIRKKQRKSYLGGIAHFLEEWRGTDDGFTRIINEKQSKYGPNITLSYSCLDPSIITKTVFDI